MVELVPVIELGHYDTGISAPKAGPFWKNSMEWDQFYTAYYAKAGFADPLPTYLPGSSFCRIEDLSDRNLQKLVKDHTKDMREGKYTREEASAFFGGYVLRLNENDKYFPQCCGDLSDIQYWQKLAYEGELTFYQGHPVPAISITSNRIIFDFTVDEFEEGFVPPVIERTIEVNQAELATAVEKVKKQLENFSNKLMAINLSESLGVSDIDNLLVWGDQVNI
ncbi:MAG: hypothetical protein V4649_07220 [Bacteroidota bacterium]